MHLIEVQQADGKAAGPSFRRVSSLRVGGDVAEDIEIEVFDIPQDQPVDGFLGYELLVQERSVGLRARPAGPARNSASPVRTSTP